MKRFFVITIILSALFISCVRRHEHCTEPQIFVFSSELQHIDSLMQRSPDSALIMLTSFRPTERSGEISNKFNNNYQSLLLSEALYKTDNAQLNRYRNETFQETSLQDAIHCFDSLYASYPTNDGLAMLSARSHYMNGVGFYENDSMVDACKEYLHALEIMENHFDEKELVGYKAKFMGLTYNRLKELFTNQFMIENAIYCGKKSLVFYEIAPTSQYGISNTLAKLGQLYDISGQNDSAYYYYNEALRSLPDSNNLIYRDLISSMAVLFYELGYGLMPTLEQIKQVADQAESEDELLTRYYTIGSLYFEEKIYDSAIIYLNIVYNNEGNGSLRKLQTADFLMNINNILDDTLKANKYSGLLSQNTMSQYEKYLAEHTVAQYDNMKEVSVIDKLFNDYLNWQKHKLQYHKQKNIIHLTIVCLIFVAIIVFFVMHRWNKKRMAHHKEALKKTEDSLSEIKMKLEVKQFINEPVCQKILSVVKKQQFKSKIDYNNYKEYSLGLEQIVELRTAVNLHYDNFTIRLKDRFPELTSDDIDYCCLYLLGLKDSDVSALMQKEYSTIRYRRSKIKNIFKTDKTLTETLYNLTNV